ncbi:MAG: hypothetical protein GYB64_18290 [Chloroflexi bacterium]|nr:hypothetical protein [Chloroflexota bacterium]
MQKPRLVLWGGTAALGVVGSLIIIFVCVGFGIFSTRFANDFTGTLTEYQMPINRFALAMNYGDTERAYGLLSERGRETLTLGQLEFWAENGLFEGTQEVIVDNVTTLPSPEAQGAVTFDDAFDALDWVVSGEIGMTAGSLSFEAVVGQNDGEWEIHSLSIVGP